MGTPEQHVCEVSIVAARGKQVFEREGCGTCHTAPLYTNNKLTLAQGFTPPAGADTRYEFMPLSVGTNPVSRSHTAAWIREVTIQEVTLSWCGLSVIPYAHATQPTSYCGVKG